jgi:hypothetical protein
MIAANLPRIHTYKGVSFSKEVHRQNLLGAHGFVLHKELYICTFSYNLKILYVYYYYDAIETISCVKNKRILNTVKT